MVLKKLIHSMDNAAIEALLRNLNTTINGISDEEAENRIKDYGYNKIGESKRSSTADCNLSPL